MTNEEVLLIPIGGKVAKTTGDYVGPGKLRGIIYTEKGDLRAIVGHKIEGGDGELLHTYAAHQLMKVKEDIDNPQK